MRNRDSGIYLSKRIVYITIAVSLCLNAFFLMMGILIGKDDSKWDQQQVAEDPTPYTQPVEDEKDDLDSELAHFQPVDESKPPAPLDLSASEPQTVAAKPPVVTPKPAREQPKQETKPAPTQPKPKPAPASTAATAASLAPGYWVQVLATENRKKADNFRAEITKLGYPTALINESPFYKVLVGPHSDQGDAKRAQSQINQRYNAKAWIRKI